VPPIPSDGRGKPSDRGRLTLPILLTLPAGGCWDGSEAGLMDESAPNSVRLLSEKVAGKTDVNRR